jgi:DNA-binding MarR family transcriptional regulator
MGHNRSSEDAELGAWRSFLSAHARVLARLDADLTAECDMTVSEYEVLAHLSEAPDHRMRMNELANLTRLSPSGLTRRFDSLVRRGWVARERCDDDRRGVLAELTGAGLDRFNAARPVHDRGAHRYFAEVLGDEATAFGDAMARVAAANTDEHDRLPTERRRTEQPERRRTERRSDASEPAVSVGDR